MSLPSDYLERVYAGVLGKCIGVYLGRPFEGWTFEQITSKLGEINYYVHEQLGVPLVVTDDDIAGTFTFLRALPDNGNDPNLTAAQIGQTWLNYLIENRTVLWWGGLGNSTEHTAYLRLKNHLPAPLSGSMVTNSRVVAEQIGAQIFIDGWAMVSPGDPTQAADLAKRAASVSHDGEAVHAAQLLAAMEAQAFVDKDVDKLLDTGVSFIPADSLIYKLVQDVRTWHGQYPDWHDTRQKIVEYYGYDKYGGNCHVVPNHALILMGLLYGQDDFQRAMTIVNTSGWDTDCNSGNLGCLMALRLGLAGLEAGPDWRGPVADRMFLSTADGGRCVTDAVAEAYRIANIGRALAGLEPLAPKGNARFHFDLPGAVQGFYSEEGLDSQATLILENVAGHSEAGSYALALHYHGLAHERYARAITPTFIQPGDSAMPGYALLASPTLYAGQTITAKFSADAANRQPVTARLFLSVYGYDDQLEKVLGPEQLMQPGSTAVFTWKVPALNGRPIARVGIELAAEQRTEGTLYLDELTWEGTPEVAFTRTEDTGKLALAAWVNGMDNFTQGNPQSYQSIQNQGTGLAIQGCREWSDYHLSADVTPHMARAAGIAARVQGMARYYALMLSAQKKICLIKALEGEKVLVKLDFDWEYDRTYQLELEVVGHVLRGWADHRLLFTFIDQNQPLMEGAIALVCEEGRTATDWVKVRPV